jgi:hypothetical protein
VSALDWPTVLAYRPFLEPLPVWNVWFLLIVPLCVGIAVVWKSIKCRTMAEVPREAGVLLLWVIGGFAAAAAALVALVKFAGLG